MVTFVLMMLVWTGQNLEVTPIKTYQNYDACLSALSDYRRSYRKIDVENAQLVCWPRHDNQ